MQRVDERRARSDPAAVTLPAASRFTTLRRVARFRRSAGIGLLVLPTLLVVAQDLGRRGGRLLAFDGLHCLTYAAAIFESMLVWAVLLYAASRRVGWMRWLAAALFVVGHTFAVGGQAYFFGQYNAYLNVDVSVFASNFMDSVANQLFADIDTYLMAKLPPFAGACAVIWVGRRWLRPRRKTALAACGLAPLLLVGALFVPTQHRQQQASTPDVLYLNAVGGLLRTQLGLTDESNQLRPRARESLPVVALSPRPEIAGRNVLLLILESVRSDAVCVEPDPNCRRTPYSNELTPDRHPFTQLRAHASSTAISLAVLWSGVGPHESRDVLHTWPLIFDYARASGYDTAFWTSQNMMFGNARLWVKNLGVSKFISATELDPAADLDMGAPEHLLAEHVKAQIGTLTEPFLAVVQLSNVHYPYLLDPDGPQPFQPATTSKAPDVNGSFFNHYKNAVHQQDRHVAEMLRHLRSTDYGQRTVVLYTSDHGEAFREHNQMGHTFSVFDEEIHVPGWLDAPAGLLSEAEQDNLRSKRHAFTFHVDITPTVLDLIGVLDDPGISPYRHKFLGTSLLQPGVTNRALPLTNCAGVWSCAFENWGYMQGPRKLAARSWSGGWECYDLEADPFERRNLGLSACSDLRDQALATFGRLPGQRSTH
jgi:glucan phosphoethanolaminetransferase (alkaline phosphatase superfamily)